MWLMCIYILLVPDIKIKIVCPVRISLTYVSFALLSDLWLANFTNPDSLFENVYKNVVKCNQNCSR